jgi:hypothetical protein
MNAGEKWGRWYLMKSNWMLVHRDAEGHKYEIDLKQMRTGDAVLHCICHVSEREERVTHEDVGYLVQALSEIFYHLPSHFKEGKEVNVMALLNEKYGVT